MRKLTTSRGGGAMERIKNFISVSEGFQKSINIEYDITNEDKIKGFILTSASLELIEEIMLSTYPNSTERARILVGAYGKGKSHIVLVLLSLLMRKDRDLFKNLLPKIQEYNRELYDYICSYIESDRKFLPVLIQGGSSLSQSFLLGLKRALSNEELDDILPDTHFKAAIETIDNWKKNYPDTYKKLEKDLNEPLSEFIEELKDYNAEVYERFVKMHPALASGAEFNPFISSNVVELYENVTHKIKSKGYDGIFVIYDEFSKLLESGIDKISALDTRLLQDFAEKCCRSKENQMHILLITHKDITNYIDKLSKSKVDGWRGVSGRYKAVEIRNNFSQIYEIIANVIEQDDPKIKQFFKANTANFNDTKKYFSGQNLFSEITPELFDTVIYSCYPLHPVSTFILPRLSEKVAQNERTIFTFLSAEHKHTLSAFIHEANDVFPILTPDYIYDYFEPLLKKEAYTNETYKLWKLTENIIRKIEKDKLGVKIIKTIALIYIVNQFDKLPPIPEIIINTFRHTVKDISIITKTLEELENKQYVIYMKRSNHYLKLKDTTGINIGSMITDAIEKVKINRTLKEILNSVSFDNYLYPTSYNDDHEITRYFDFTFIECDELCDVQNWSKKIANTTSDGVVFGVITHNEDDVAKATEYITSGKGDHDRIVFILSQKDYEIEKVAYEYQAVKELKEHGDDSLSEELDIYIEDLEEVMDEFLSTYLKPEMRLASYYYKGEKKLIYRKALISQLLSEICSKVFKFTPIIINEVINKDLITTNVVNYRNKVISGLLANQLEPNLGLGGTGQDIAIMRSVLVKTGVLANFDTSPNLIMSGNSDENVQTVLDEIQNFIKKSANGRNKSFGILYERLTIPDYGIGLKKGVIPVFLAAVLHSFKQYVVITKNNKELEITATLLSAINENPYEYNIGLENWNDDKENYIKELEKLFSDYINEKEKEYNTFSYITKAMVRWLTALPKYSKELKKYYIGNGEFEKIELNKQKFISALKSPEINAREFLFKRILDIFPYKEVNVSIVDNISSVKAIHDQAKNDLINKLVADFRHVFAKSKSEKQSLSSILKDWHDGLQETTKNHLFSNGEDRVLDLIKHMTSDEGRFIEFIAKEFTGLRIDDWDTSTISVFISSIAKFKETVEIQDKENLFDNKQDDSNIYKLIFIDKNGKEEIKTFYKTECSDRANLLYNDLTATLDEYAEALSENEKRQILMNIIENLCR